MLARSLDTEFAHVPELEVLISGLGVAGPTLAWWLRRSGFKPTIVERSPAPRTGGYLIDFWGVGFEVADRMGLLPVLRRDGYAMTELRLVDARGRRVAGVNVRAWQKAFGDRFMTLPRGDLAHRVDEALADDVEIIFDDTIAAVAEDASGVTVSFARGAPRRFHLLVGADGLHSNVRALVFGPHASFERYLGYYTAAFSATDYPHRDEGVYVGFGAPGRQAARYALRDGRTAFWFVFAQDTPLAIGHHDERAQRAMLRSRFAGAGWECDEMLARLDGATDFYFDAVAQTRMPCWSRGRVALVGDAAYCPSLLAGQGTSFGMAGAYLIARGLARQPRDHAAAFAEYEALFRPFVERKQDAAARFAEWFAPRSRGRLWLRNLATSAMNLPLVGSRLAKRSFADDLDLPAAVLGQEHAVSS